MIETTRVRIFEFFWKKSTTFETSWKKSMIFKGFWLKVRKVDVMIITIKVFLNYSDFLREFVDAYSWLKFI